jgi:hypothetical protein
VTHMRSIIGRLYLKRMRVSSSKTVCELRRDKKINGSFSDGSDIALKKAPNNAAGTMFETATIIHSRASVLASAGQPRCQSRYSEKKAIIGWRNLICYVSQDIRMHLM